MLFRALRQKIQAIRIRRLGWSDFVFHYIMEQLGFGSSLRALSEPQLHELFTTINSYRKHGKPQEFTYDRHGMYMHSLQKRAGWDDRTMIAYLTITYGKTHWNLLTKPERSQVISHLNQAITQEQEQKEQ